jgi:hypothetical protein
LKEKVEAEENWGGKKEGTVMEKMNLMQL